MITIENAKLIVSEFNSDLNKLNFSIINNQVIENAEKLVSALKLFKYMTKNNLNKIDGSYYINPKYEKIINEDDDVSKYYDPLDTDGRFNIIVLDEKSPLYLKEVSIKVSHMFNDGEDSGEYRYPRLLEFLVNGKELYYSDNEYKVCKPGKYVFPPLHETIMKFIEDSKLGKKEFKVLYTSDDE